MRSRAVVVVTLLTLAAACGGKIAPEGQGGQGGGGSSGTGGTGGTGTAAPPPGSVTAPAPTPSPPGSGNRPGAQCPASPPGEGSDCGWQYGIPCDYGVSRSPTTCAVQCICVGNDHDTNRWTCFDIGCDEG